MHGEMLNAQRYNGGGHSSSASNIRPNRKQTRVLNCRTVTHRIALSHVSGINAYARGSDSRGYDNYQPT